MSDFVLYKQAREAINNIITSKEDEIKKLNTEIAELKSTRNMIDQQQKQAEIAKYIG